MLKYVNDYIPKIKEKFPYLSEKDIRKIVEYGWRMMYRYTLFGCDINIKSNHNKSWFYLGYLNGDSVKHYEYYRYRLRKKIKVVYHQKVKIWDGYYYIGLTNKEYEDFVKSKNSVGRKRKYYKFTNKVMYKIQDEAKVMYWWSKCILRFKYLTDRGDTFTKKSIQIENPEVVLEREGPAKLTDIMVSSDNYILV